MPQSSSYMCRALIEGRQARALLRFTEGFGNWIQGTVTLSDEHVRFSITRANALLQQDGSDLIIPYQDVTSCTLGRLAYVLKTVDLETTQYGVVRFRCLFAWNERLLADLQKRMGSLSVPTSP